MRAERKDPVTGQQTTGHEWNGIEELDTPIPKFVFMFLGAALLFALVYWLLMPAFPLGWTYTKGILGNDQRETVLRQINLAEESRTGWTSRIAGADFNTITADDTLMLRVRDAGKTLFSDNCAACHGADGAGGPGFPDLLTDRWLWGGDPNTIAETVRVGINSAHDETRVSQMLAFGRDGILSREQVREVSAYVRSLSGQTLNKADQARVDAGGQIFADNCVACHAENGRGLTELGAPDLTDQNWVYGGDPQSVFNTIFGGRQGHMPHWQGRLSDVEIKVLAAYVSTLSGARQQGHLQ